jgi:penicillin amidase
MPRRWLAVPISLCAIAAFVASHYLVRAQSSGADQFKALARQSLSQISGELALPGLKAPVEVIRDTWGIPHIYAQNTDDLFMAQGYVMAQDRLWQMELWRRDREGRMAEILGAGAVNRDRTARLLKYRGPMDDREWTSYHPEGKRIFTAYASGVNAYIASHKDNLPLEFKITGITPEPWTAETCVLRSATFGDVNAELTLARNVARLGVEQANRQRAPDPFDELKVPDGLDLSTIDDQVTTGGRGGGGGGRGGGRGGGNRPELIEPYRSWMGGSGPTAASEPVDSPGSNNWVVSGRLSATGKPIVANDPHRDVSNPSLRYIVHLNAPGWNVIGSGEPPFVGVAIGHNDRLAWGLTIVGTDQEDVYVEEVNPANAGEVKWQNGWEPVRVVREDIAVKGEAARTVELKYTRHGPVFYEDTARRRIYAMRSALLEPGAAAYLGGLRLAQAKNCREFLDAAMYWKAPTENLICGDVDGNIAWQASALTPNRKGWVGRLPVPGDGRYEWDGFRTALPRELNPDRGFVATANNNINTPGYWPPVVFKSSNGTDFERMTRLKQMIRPLDSARGAPGKTYTIDDMKAMQLDAMNLRAQSELALFKGWTSATPAVERARQMIASWDAVQSRESAAAALYQSWRTGSTAEERDAGRSVDARRPLLEAGLTRAIGRLTTTQGADWSTWRWGRMHTQAFPHQLVPVFNLPTIERRGGTGTVAADGATYREIMDVADWDRSVVTNVPGQSGQPESKFYGNLLALFGSDTYFQLAYSRAAVDRVAAERLRLRP